MPCSDCQTRTATMDHGQNVMSSQLQDSTNTDLLYKKILAPRVEHINHASRIGVRLKSAALLERSPSATGSSRTGQPTRIKSSPQKYSGYQQPAQYIHDIVVPIQRSPSYDTDPRHLTSASSSQIHSHLPQMGGSARPRRGLTVSAAASSTGSPLVDAVLQRKEGRGPWKNNKQVMRFEMEQQDRARCRLFKKVSEVRPHRVDRMYYMSGAPVHLKNRFHVDEEELEQLKQLAKARRDAKQYGRGFSKFSPPGLYSDGVRWLADHDVIFGECTCNQHTTDNTAAKGPDVPSPQVAVTVTDHGEVPPSAAVNAPAVSMFTVELQPCGAAPRSQHTRTYTPSGVNADIEAEVQEHVNQGSAFHNRFRDGSLVSPRFGGWTSHVDCACKHGEEKHQKTFVLGSRLMPAGTKLTPTGDKLVPAGTELIPAGSGLTSASKEMTPGDTEV